jgi:CBS-domain-containing membrane protein
MKTRLKNWITSVIGILLMILSGYFMYAKYEILYIGVSMGIGTLLLFAKDTLIKTFSDYLTSKFK